jgi:hypothetical protein
MYLLRYLRRLELHKKSSRYILYAFGEVVLIVVGIMIALQINVWNQERANRDLERNYLHRFQVDLEEDLSNFREQVELGQAGLEAVKEAVALIHRENVEDDFYRLNALYDLADIDIFNAQYSTYEELESTGQLNLIHDDALRLAIQKHYAFYKKMEVAFDHLWMWRKNVTHSFDAETSTLKYVDWNKAIFPPETRSDKDWAILNDRDHPEFKKTETALAATSFWITWHLEDYEEIIPKTEELKKLITEAIEGL